MSIDKKLSSEKKKHIEADYDLTLADEVTQQMKTYVRSTTTRVTKRFLDSCETSSPKRSTRTKWNIEGDESKTQTYQELIEDVGNNPFLVTEHIKEDEGTNTSASMLNISNILNDSESNEVGDSPTSTVLTTPYSYKDKGILNLDSSELQEGWYNSNIVAPFFDDCLASLNDCILRRYVQNRICCVILCCIQPILFLYK
ncbi:7335_t:CDS:2 [Acaulospora colombiana]|uniref:7335_t:CDS:1 n=1 Tax=Acaulospora colombiana TaxID=27376 RepID=A0ACA9K3L4_9GLOM|nr:7335_t:CDS:2 [Acaulospora colombiana]